MQSNTVRIVAHTSVLPNGDTVRVENDGAKATSRQRAEGYVKRGAANWLDYTHEAIYFCDPAILQLRNEEQRSGVHSWYVGDSGGSSFVKAHSSGRRPGQSGVSGGYRVFKTDGGQKSYMDTK